MSRGPWLQIASGRAWYPLDPRPDDVCLEDIRAISRICRYGGQIYGAAHYSVAEHCVRVARAMLDDGIPAYYALAGLLHDAHEAYPPGDVPSPLKHLPGFELIRKMERDAQRAVCKALTGNADFCNLSYVKYYDLVLLSTERRDLMVDSNVDWGDLPPPLPQRITPLSAEQAWDEWLEMFATLRVRALAA